MVRRLSTLAAAARHGALLTSGALMLLPFVWMLSVSLKPPGEIFASSLTLLPQRFYGVENYAAALQAAPLLRFMLNGVIVCSLILSAQLLTALPCGYALAKLRFPGRRSLFALVLTALLIPHQVLAIPLFFVCYQLGILNSYAGLVLPFIVSPFGIFMFRQFFKAVPDELVQAARLDGLGEFGILWRLMVPIARPAVAAFAVFSVIANWNDLFWPLIAVRSEALMPPALGVMVFHSEEAGTAYGPMMAGGVILVAPLLAVFLMLQRWFVEGAGFGAAGAPAER